MMRSYISHLKSITTEADRKREEEARAKRPLPDPRASEQWEPLVVQIRMFMDGLPPVRRDRAWAMDELIVHLHGHYKPRPSRGDVGQALRALGWVPSRDWSVQGGSGRRVWILPDTD